MGCRGVHFALTAKQASRLMDTPGANNGFLLQFVQEIEEAWDKKWLQESDKAWDAIHRCLTDGKLEYGDTVMHKCILGPDNLYEGRDYIINFMSPEEVKELAAAIKDIDRDELRRRYDTIDTRTYGKLSEGDFEYTWGWFRHLPGFFRKAARAKRAVIFTVDQ